MADFLFDALYLEEGYILCPKNDLDRVLDARRIRSAADDIAENRPLLSCWHPDHAAAFRDWLRTQKRRPVRPDAFSSQSTAYFWMQVSTVSLVHSSRPVKIGSATASPLISEIIVPGAR